mgnify:CR=1 FL=1
MKRTPWSLWRAVNSCRRAAGCRIHVGHLRLVELVRVFDALAAPAEMEDAVTMAHGTVRSPFKSLRKKRFAARAIRRR